MVYIPVGLGNDILKMQCIYFVLVFCILTGFICFAQQSCENVDDEQVNKVTDLEDADIIFAGLFPIKHEGCEEYQAEKGVERMEAMIRALQLINNDTNLLTGISKYVQYVNTTVR